jgi:valyl-tRNA synthetase
MILMTTYALDDIPYKDVYIHGILRAKDGRKFSKSLGNGLDPLEIIEKYGTDALRLSLIKGTTAGNDARFYEEKVEAARNFVNKLWNISRYILSTVENPRLVEVAPEPITLADKWLLDKLNAKIYEATKQLDNCEFSLASEILYDFTWSDFADWYLEVAKIEKGKDDILLYVLQTLLRLWHPYMPFITEEIWDKLADERILMVESWPVSKEVGLWDKIKEIAYLSVSEGGNDFEVVKELIIAIRNLRAENKIEPAKLIDIVIISAKKELLESQAKIIKRLARLQNLAIDSVGVKPENSAVKVIEGSEIYLVLAGLINIGAEKERLAKEIMETEKYLSGLQSKMDNEEFVKNAPKAVVEKEKEKLTVAEEKLAKLREQVNSL